MKLKRHTITTNKTLKEALKQINMHSNSVLLLFVIDKKQKLVGSLTDGDIRRGLINGVNLNEPVTKIMFRNFLFAQQSEIDKKIKSININQVKLLPIVDKDGRLIDVVNLLDYKPKLPVDAFIMAGGKGQRLLPLTEKTPKPLLNIGSKPIIEHNIDRLIKIGVENIYISVNYLGDQIKAFLIKRNKQNVNIFFIEETEFLGTIGSLSRVENFQNNTILLMNSDLLTNFDLREMHDEFYNQKADILIATVPYKVNVPYAVMEVEEKKVRSFKEKPTFTFQCNAGIYLLKKEAINYIPKNKYYNATDLMEKMINLEMNVSYYPILGYWLDIGKREDFKKANIDIKHLKL